MPAVKGIFSRGTLRCLDEQFVRLGRNIKDKVVRDMRREGVI